MSMFRPFQGVLYDYEVVTVVGALSHSDGDAPAQGTFNAPEGKVILSVDAYYYADYAGTSTDPTAAYQNMTVPVLIAADGRSVSVASAQVAIAQAPTNTVVQMVCARIND